MRLCAKFPRRGHSAPCAAPCSGSGSAAPVAPGLACEPSQSSVSSDAQRCELGTSDSFALDSCPPKAAEHPREKQKWKVPAGLAPRPRNAAWKATRAASPPPKTGAGTQGTSSKEPQASEVTRVGNGL